MSRVFVGIPLSDEIKTEIENWGKVHKDFPVRWLEKKNLHITIVAPWKEHDVPAVLEKLKTLEGKSGIDLEFKEVRFGPNERSPRLIWAFGEIPTELKSLAKETHAVLEQPMLDREFLLHTTLARFRPEEFSNFKVKKLKEEVNWKMKAEKLVLFRSKLRAIGADYIPLGEVGI